MTLQTSSYGSGVISLIRMLLALHVQYTCLDLVRIHAVYSNVASPHWNGSKAAMYDFFHVTIDMHGQYFTL